MGIVSRYTKGGSAMEREILVCLDGSDLAEQVVPLAARFARATGSGLALLHVVPPPTILQGVIWPTEVVPQPPANRESLIEEAHAYLKSVARHWQTPDLPIRYDVITGDPAESIVTYSVDHPAITMIALATHGRGGVGRWLFGSVAATLLQISIRPLLLLRVAHALAPTAATAPRSILVPLDGSASAAQALHEAEDLARAFGATLLLVRVVPAPAEIVSTGLGSLWLLERYAQDTKQIAAALAHQAQELRARVIPAHAQVLCGDPADEILAVAEREHVDLIVLSTHGQATWDRFWVGSVALRVLQRARPATVVNCVKGPVDSVVPDGTAAETPQPALAGAMR
jgi:nucleotide-binding universal stress UspA family protein